jgi:DNA primase
LKVFDNSAVYRAALPLFAAALESPQAEPIRRYLVDMRDLRPAFVRSRQIGVYPGPRMVAHYLLRQGLPQQRITQSGILRRDVDGALVIPWKGGDDAPGVLVFRRMEPPQAPGEAKSKSRYVAIGVRDDLPPDGLKEAALAGAKRVVVVEGTFDFLFLRQQGEIDVVTPHSCAIRPPHFSKLRQAGVDEIVVAFDSDDAGRRATLTAIELAMSMQQRIKVAATLPKGVDADEFVRKNGVKPWRALVARSTPGLSYYAEAVIAQFGAGAPKAPEARRACLNAAAAFHAKRRPDLPSDDLEREFWPIILRAIHASDEDKANAVRAAYADAIARRQAALNVERVRA